MSNASHTIRAISDTTPRSENAYADDMPPGQPDRGAAFGALIRDAFTRSGWTQERLVEETGISRSTLSRWMRGHAERPDAEQVRAACLALGIDPRRAAIALGFLTDDDLTGTSGLGITYTTEVAEALEILADPALPSSKREEALSYLRWVRAEARKAGNGGKRSAS